MIKSEFIRMVENIEDPTNPTSNINLQLHRIPGGIIGIEPSFTENIGNYIPNPFDEASFVFLSEPLAEDFNSDPEPDPPLAEDDLFGFMLLVRAIGLVPESVIVNERKIEKEKFLEAFSLLTNLNVDQIKLLIGKATQSVEDLVFGAEEESHTGENGKAS